MASKSAVERAKVGDPAIETMGGEMELHSQWRQTCLGSSREQSRGQTTEITAWEAQLKL